MWATDVSTASPAAPEPGPPPSTALEVAKPPRSRGDRNQRSSWSSTPVGGAPTTSMHASLPASRQRERWSCLDHWKVAAACACTLPREEGDAAVGGARASPVLGSNSGLCVADISTGAWRRKLKWSSTCTSLRRGGSSAVARAGGGGAAHSAEASTGKSWCRKEPWSTPCSHVTCACSDSTVASPCCGVPSARPPLAAAAAELEAPSCGDPKLVERMRLPLRGGRPSAAVE